MKPIAPEKMSREKLIARIKALESARATSSEDHLSPILETAAEGILTLDEHGLIESANAAAARIFGYSAKEIIGRNVRMLMPSPHHKAPEGDIDNFLRMGVAKIIGARREMAGRRKNGRIFPMDLSVSEVKSAARRRFTVFIRDITERKQLEKEILEISDREQRRVGHDLHDGLCQHLAGIELMSQVLAQKLAPKSKACAKQVGEIASHVRDAISHTRSLARGLSPVTIESEGLMSALHELATNTEKNFRTYCRCDFGKPVAIRDHAVATHLFRIAQEAVANAIKHGKAGRIVIKLRKTRGRILLEINDNGSGLRKKPTNHKGMGLRIMQSRASMIGGTMGIESNRGGGVSVICALSEERVVLKH